MALDGKWKVVMKSPMGAVPSALDIATSGNVLSGTMSGQGRTSDINGTVEGNTASWSVLMTVPMKMTLEFKVTADGDTLTGQVKAGPFGTLPLSGSRA